MTMDRAIPADARPNITSLIGVHWCASVAQNSFFSHRCTPINIDKHLKKEWMESLIAIICFPSLVACFAEDVR
jgi:hypothetical protein